MRNTKASRIFTYLDNNKFTYYVDKDEESETILTIPVTLDGLPTTIIKCYITNTGKCTFILRFGVVKNPLKVSSMLPLINELNETYSFTRFSISKSGSVCVSLQFITDVRTRLDVIDDYFGTFISIFDKTSKVVIPVIWDEVREPETELFDNDEVSDDYDEGSGDYDEVSDDIDESFDDVPLVEDDALFEEDELLDQSDSDEDWDDESDDVAV